MLKGCDTRKLQKQKSALRKVSDKRVLLSAKKKLIVLRGVFCCIYRVPSYLRSLVSSFEIMLRKMYLIPAHRLHGSPFMTREPTVSKRKQKAPVKKRKHHAKAVKIRKHHPYEQWLKVRQEMEVAGLRKKTETNAFADFLSRVMPPVYASKVSPPPPPPPPPMPTPPKLRRGTQTDVTSASFTASPSAYERVHV